MVNLEIREWKKDLPPFPPLDRDPPCFLEEELLPPLSGKNQHHETHVHIDAQTHRACDEAVGLNSSSSVLSSDSDLPHIVCRTSSDGGLGWSSSGAYRVCFTLGMDTSFVLDLHAANNVEV